MATLLEGNDNEIVAIACKDFSGELHFIYCERPICSSDLVFEEESVHIHGVFVMLKWFTDIIICTKETLANLKQTLQIA